MRPPVLIPLFFVLCGLVFAAIDAFPRRNEMERSDWNVSAILDAMDKHRESEGKLHVVCLPWRVYFNMEILHLAAAAQGLELSRVYVPGGDGGVDFDRVAEAEFILTSPRAREFDGELPWQNALRVALESGEGILNDRWTVVEIFSMPDGSQATLWMQSKRGTEVQALACRNPDYQ